MNDHGDISIMLLLRREPRQLAIATAIGVAVGIAYMIPMGTRQHACQRCRLPQVGFDESATRDGSAVPLIKSPEYTHAFVFSGRRHFPCSCVNLAWVLFALAGAMAITVRKRFWDCAKTYPAEAIFAGTFAVFLFSYSAPMCEFYFFPRFVISLIPFLLFVFSDYCRATGGSYCVSRS